MAKEVIGAPVPAGMGGVKKRALTPRNLPISSTLVR